MINLRYHIVSLAAVFLALAAGVALGSHLLVDVGSHLDNSSDTDSGTLTSSVAQFDAGYAARTRPALLKDRLSGRSVLILTTPQARKSEVDGIVADLKAAGATVTGQLGLTVKLLDPANRQFAQGVATQAGGDAVSGTDAYANVGSAIGHAYLSPGGGAPDSTANTIRSAFTEGGLLQTVSAPTANAQLALVISGPADSVSSDEGTVIGAIAPQLDAASRGVLVAGPSSSGESSGVIGRVRDSDAAKRVSTFDVTELATGQATAVLALAQEAAGTTGSWGTSRAANGPMPQ